MKMLDDFSIGNIIAIGTGVLGFIALFFEKVRTFLLSRRIFSKSKAEIRKDTFFANDDVLDKLSKRIDILNDDYLQLLEKNSITVKENFELKKVIYKVSSRCVNNCKEDV